MDAKAHFSLALLVSLSLLPACRTQAPDSETLASSGRQPAGAANEITFANSFKLDDYRGHTYLSFMQSQVKPAMDRLARDGYQVCDADAIAKAYKATDRKVQGKVDKSWGGLSKVQAIADKLAGQTVTLNTLPAKLRLAAPGVDAYGLATFIGLACGGGVKVSYYDRNYSLNVHYDQTEQRSGRSFGVGPTRPANDASDKDYLDDLQASQGLARAKSAITRLLAIQPQHPEREQLPPQWY